MGSGLEGKLDVLTTPRPGDNPDEFCIGLRSAGFSVDYALSADDAKRMLQEKRPAVFFVYSCFPQNGLEKKNTNVIDFVREISSISPDTKYVAYMPNGASGQDEETLKKSGLFADVVKLPLNYKKYIKAVAEAAGKTDLKVDLSKLPE